MPACPVFYVAIDTNYAPQVLIDIAEFARFNLNIRQNFVVINYPAATESLLQLLSLMRQMRYMMPGANTI